MTSLTAQDIGKYKILTKSGAEYQLNLDDKQLTRFVDIPVGVPTPTIGSPDDDFGEYKEGQSQLRADNNTVPLVNILQCEVGSSATFLVTGLHDDAVTIRHTSVVMSIEKI